MYVQTILFFSNISKIRVGGSVKLRNKFLSPNKQNKPFTREREREREREIRKERKRERMRDEGGPKGNAVWVNLIFI